MTVLWLVGEPCIGKTAVAAELLRRAGNGAEVTLSTPHVSVCGSAFAAGDFTSSVGIGYAGRRPLIIARWASLNLATSELLILDGDVFANPPVAAELAHHRRLAVVLEGSELARQRRRDLGVRVTPQDLAADQVARDRWVTDFPGRTARVLADQRPRQLAEVLLTGVVHGPPAA